MGYKNYGSVYGAPYQRFRYLLKYIENYYKMKPRILIVNDCDGLHTLQAVRKGYNVDCYETNKLLLNGGSVDGYKIVGFKEKLRFFNMLNYVNLYENNFYNKKVENHYDLVYCYKSLHLKDNSDFDLKKKVKKLMTATNKNGFLYIFYHLAKNPFDYHTYPKNEYFRKGEMIKIFDSSWDIIYINENNIETNDHPHPFNNKKHKHLVGHILAKKKDNRDYDLNYKITSMNYLEYKKWRVNK